MPISRRAFLSSLTVGSLALAGCATRPAATEPDDSTTPNSTTSDSDGATNDDSATDAGTWPMDGHDPGRSSSTTESAVPTTAVEAAWSRERSEDSHSASAPVVGPDRVFIGYSESTDTNGVYDARIAGFDATSGTEAFDVSVASGRIVGLALYGGHVIAVTRGDGDSPTTMVAASRRTGEVDWRTEIPAVTGAPALRGDTLFLATQAGDNTVYAYSVDGAEQWHTAVDGECYNAPCVGEDTVFVGLADGRIAALDTTTGDPRWTEPGAPDDPCCPDIQGTPTYAEGRLFVPGIDEHLRAVDTADGSTIWEQRVVPQDYGNPVPSPAVADGTAYVNTHHGSMLALDTADGEVVWQSDENGNNQPPAVGRDGVVFPFGERVLGVDRTGETRWTFEMHVPDAPGMTAYLMDPEVTLAHDRVYVSVHDGRLWAVDAAE